MMPGSAYRFARAAGAVSLALVLVLSGTARAQDPPADVRQVQVQVWISETNESGLRDIGANLNYTRFVRGEEQSGSVQQISTNVFDPGGDFQSVTVPTPDRDLFGPTLREEASRDEVPGQDGIQTRSGIGLEMSVINPGYGTIDAVFRAIERKTDVDLISKPELLVINNGTATIKAGGEVPFQDAQYDAKGNLQLGVKWQDVGVSLTMQPTILANDFVQLNVQQLEVTDVPRIENLRGVDLPVFAKRSQTGNVVVPSGQTIVIGGLSSRIVRKTERRVPVVGRIPILGIPFRSRNSEADVTHLLIFVSPTVVDLRNLTPDASNALNFWRERGGEWQSRDRIERELEAMEDEL